MWWINLQAIPTMHRTYGKTVMFCEDKSYFQNPNRHFLEPATWAQEIEQIQYSYLVLQAAPPKQPQKTPKNPKKTSWWWFPEGNSSNYHCFQKMHHVILSLRVNFWCLFETTAF